MDKKRRSKACAFFLLVLGMAYTGSAQDSTSDIQKDIEALKRGQQQIPIQLQEIRSLLFQRTANRGTLELNVRGLEFKLEDSPLRGRDSAKLILVDFTDYKCCTISAPEISV